MSSNPNYLLIIDPITWDKQITDYFTKFDYAFIQLSTLDELDKQISEPSALLINWVLLKSDFSIIDKLYHRFTVPLIVVNDVNDENVCVNVLEAGADDFIIKPIHPRELHARITAITRRVQRSTVLEQEKELFLFADWSLDPASRRVFNRNTSLELQLSSGEYDLLLAFINQPLKVLDREFLSQLTKTVELNPFDRRIDVQISRLRQKIEVDTKKPALIKTIRNGGYLFTAQVKLVKENDMLGIKVN